MIIVGRLIKGIFGGDWHSFECILRPIDIYFQIYNEIDFLHLYGDAGSICPIDLMMIFEKNRSLSNWFLVNAIDEKAEEGDFLCSITHSNSFMEPLTASSDTSSCHPQYPP